MHRYRVLYRHVKVKRDEYWGRGGGPLSKKKDCHYCNQTGCRRHSVIFEQALEDLVAYMGEAGVGGVELVDCGKHLQPPYDYRWDIIDGKEVLTETLDKEAQMANERYLKDLQVVLDDARKAKGHKGEVKIKFTSREEYMASDTFEVENDAAERRFWVAEEDKRFEVGEDGWDGEGEL
jgi:hypothetical protein